MPVGCEMASAAVGLGSNMGDRIARCRQAVSELAGHADIQVVKGSSWYETRPVGYADQSDFINGAVLLDTSLPALHLLDALKVVERRLGRTATWKYGPREIDLDLLIYDDLVLDIPRLALPHPAMAKRAFVLAPLAEVQPDLVHPLYGRTVSDLLDELKPVDHLVRRVADP